MGPEATAVRASKTYSDHIFSIFWSVEEPYSVFTLHDRRRGIAQESRFRLEFSRDQQSVLWGNVKKRRNGLTVSAI